MDPTTQYQNQSQPYDPSSSSAYYPYHQYGNYQYYPQDYSNYQPHPYPEESSSLHPPGVPLDSQKQYSARDQYYAYQQQQQQQQQQLDAATWQGGGASTGAAHVAAPPSQYDSTMWHDAGSVPEASHFRPHPPVGPSYTGGSRRGGRGGGSSFRGRGRGRGRVGAPPQQPAAPPRMAWCELCRVDCNTAEILQQHLEGKKHKKNLKMKEELERLDKILVEREKEKVEEPIVAETSANRGCGSKRKMRGGRGSNKWIRTSEGAKGPIDPPNPKQSLVPFFCELCHVTCESQVVFDSHLKGKKHMAKVLEQHTLLGHAALEAIYPALQAALQGNSNLNPNGSNSSAFAPQEGNDPQAVLIHLLATLLTNGQVGATPGAAFTSVPAPPLVTENTNPEILDAVNVAPKSQVQHESVNSEAGADVTVEKKVESETEKVDAPAVKT